MLSERSGMHFQGLQQASRVLRKSSRLPDRLAKKLNNIDVAFNLIRHITSASVGSFVKELDDALPSLATTGTDVPTSYAGATPEVSLSGQADAAAYPPGGEMANKLDRPQGAGETVASRGKGNGSGPQKPCCSSHSGGSVDCPHGEDNNWARIQALIDEIGMAQGADLIPLAEELCNQASCMSDGSAQWEDLLLYSRSVLMELRGSFQRGCDFFNTFTETSRS